MSNFEAGFISAVLKLFFRMQKNVRCFLHLSESIMRDVQQNKAVYERFRMEEQLFAFEVCLLTFFQICFFFNDTIFNLIKTIAALAILPFQVHAGEGTSIQRSGRHLSAITSINTSKRTTFGSKNLNARRRRENAKYPPAIWNQHHSNTNEKPSKMMHKSKLTLLYLFFSFDLIFLNFYLLHFLK